MPHSRRRSGVTSAQTLAAAAKVITLEVQALQTPLERAQLTTSLLRDVAAVQRHVAELRMTAVAELREAGWSYRSIGRALSLSPNAIAQIENQRRQAARS